jgi:murein DD-endopeptidase MepM/ murein hydrolase activator NlpD
LRRLALILAAGAVALCAAQATAADDAIVQRASVSPKQGFTDSARGVRVEFRLAGSAPADVTIRIIGGGEEVRTIGIADVPPGADRTARWDGLTDGGRLVRDGTYRVLVDVVGGARRDAGRVRLHGFFFPVRGSHGARGPVGDFNAPRDGGRRHKGFDITASCGTPLAAARTGIVTQRAYDRRLDGNFIVIKGVGERRQYLYAHMLHPSRFHRGDLVHVGQFVGRVGRTGNARTVGCHLHFELHLRGRPINPEPSLRGWDRFS